MKSRAGKEPAPFIPSVARAKLVISYQLAFFILLYGYYEFIVPIYGYTGFKWDVDRFKLLEGGIIVLIVAASLPKRFDKPSDVLLHVQFLYPIMPMLVLYGASDQPREYLYVILLAYLILVFFARNAGIKPVAVAQISPELMQRAILLLSILFIISIISFGGLRYLNFDLLRVYEYRSIAAINLPPIYGYLTPLVSKVFLPLALMLAVVKREWLFALLTIACSVMLFALTSFKSILFYPVAVLGLYYVLKRKNVIQMLLYAYIAVLLVSITGFLIEEGGSLIGSLLLRRVNFIPSYINFLYYDYFSMPTNPYVLWAESRMTFGLVEYPYDIDVPHLIGREYFGSEKTGANTGWVGSGYMQLGYIGLLFYASIVGVLLNLIDAYGKRIDKNIIVAIIIVPVRAIMDNSDLPTALFTHGFLVAILLISMVSIKNMPCIGNTVLRT